MKTDFIGGRGKRKNDRGRKDQPGMIEEQAHCQAYNRNSQHSVKRFFYNRNLPRAFVQPTVIERQTEIRRQAEEEHLLLAVIQH